MALPGTGAADGGTVSEDPAAYADAYPDLADYNATADYAADPGGAPCVLREVRDFARLFVPVAYSLVCAGGLLGNGLVALTFAFYRRRRRGAARSLTDVFLLNMALADALFVLTLPLWAAAHAAGRWRFSRGLCKLARGAEAVRFHGGMLLAAGVSLDRYAAIVQAARSLRLRARLRARRRALCLAVWALAGLLSAGTCVFSEKYAAPGVTGVDGADGVDGVEVCEPRYPAVAEPLRWKLLLLGLQLFWGFFLPLLVTGGCYLAVVRTLLARARRSERRRRALRVVAAVVLAFLACQVPHNAVLLATAARLGRLGRSCRAERLRGYLAAGAEALAFLHCCLNPVLYAFAGQRFRGHFREAARDLLCLGRWRRWWRARRAPGQALARTQAAATAPGEAVPSRQSSETAEHDSPSSFTM